MPALNEIEVELLQLYRGHAKLRDELHRVMVERDAAVATAEEALGKLAFKNGYEAANRDCSRNT